MRLSLGGALVGALLLSRTTCATEAPSAPAGARTVADDEAAHGVVDGASSPRRRPRARDEPAIDTHDEPRKAARAAVLGHVTIPSDGRVSDVRLRLEFTPGSGKEPLDTTTDSDGDYAFEDLPAGAPFRLTCACPPVPETTQDIAQLFPDERRRIDFVLTTPNVLEGALPFDVLKDDRIVLWARATSDSPLTARWTGNRFSVELWPTGPIDVVAYVTRGREMLFAWGSVTVRAGTTTDMGVLRRGAATADLYCITGGSQYSLGVLALTLRTEETVLPDPAPLRIEIAPGADGAYRLSGLPAGTTVFDARAAAANAGTLVRGHARARVELEPGPQRVELDFTSSGDVGMLLLSFPGAADERRRSGETVRYIVERLGYSGSSGAQIVVSRSGPVGGTSAMPLPPGRYRVHLFDRSKESISDIFEVQKGRVRRFEEGPWQDAAPLRGTVVRDDGTPVPGARVMLRAPAPSDTGEPLIVSWTDADGDGTFELSAYVRVPGAWLSVAPRDGEPVRIDDWDDTAPVRLVVDG